ncbi:unnamed protein product [Mesocestoides corti]|uniref:Carboxylic ester hydrolase n=2 Tax=Mesocestoides corti TaxID=53468 RepID=A0A0R3UCH6_MESCO|nr:unnamed protein product [Mesocestoides corti]
MLLFLLISVVPVRAAEVRSGDALLTLRNGVSLKGTKWTVDGVVVDAYLGIPFARPPIGNLRFAPPVEARLWKGERDATQRPNTCWQYLFSGFDLANPAARVMSEDCLYLNVWVPANMPQDGKPLPVMVWIFGGGFFSGTSTLDVYDGKFLAAKEGVIVVSMQYRLGPFGFLYVDSEVDGNMGLLDQRLALKWVQKHIAKFGGDPTKVTLFGESAGAASVTLQYLSPESRPLFQRMILQSASALNRWALSTKSVAHDAGLSVSEMQILEQCNSEAPTAGFNCSMNGRNLKKAVRCLRELPAKTLFDRLYELSVASTARRQKRLSSLLPAQWPDTFLTSAAQYFEVIMRPVLDGKFLPDCPTTLLKSIQEGQAPEALVGNVDKEGMYWLFYGLGINGIDFLSDEGTVTRPTLDQLKAADIDYFQLVQTRFMSVGHLVPQFSAITTAQYGLNSPFVKQIMGYDTVVPPNAISSEMDFLNRLDNLSGEMDFVCGTQLFAKLLAAIAGAKVQYYNFMHKTVGSQFPAWVGAMHGYETEYVFGMPYSSEFQTSFYSFTAEEKELSAKMMRYWANFARSG